MQDREGDESAARSVPGVPGRRRMLLYALLPLMLLAAAGEIGLRCVYFQGRSEFPTAIQAAVGSLRHRLAYREAQEVLAALRRRFPANPEDALFTPEGAALLDELASRYRAHFDAFVADVRGAGARLVVLYVPYKPRSKNADVRRGYCRAFFRDLSRGHGVRFVDATEELLPFPDDVVFLYPVDHHPTRVANLLLAKQLEPVLEGMLSGEVPGRGETGGPEASGLLFGDLRPNWNRVEAIPGYPVYRLVTDEHGLRRAPGIARGGWSARRRVLLLGDSYACGHFLENEETLSAALERLRPEWEVMNAGHFGYSIPDEAGLFRERARRAGAEVVLLQVTDNDLPGLLWFERNLHDRSGARHGPTPLEAAFFGVEAATPPPAPDAR